MVNRGNNTPEVNIFLQLHKNQLISSGVPEIFWETVYCKITDQIFNAGDVFQLLQVAGEEKRQSHEPAWALQSIYPLKATDPKNIFLIDHAWTFKLPQAKKQLRDNDSLRLRLCKILGLNENLSAEKMLEEVYENMWKICHTYSIQNTENIEDSLASWYVMDELGSALMHSDIPNCRVVPFFCINEQIAYSLLFPVEDIKEEEFICMDYADGITDEDQRAGALLPWVPKSFHHVSFKPNDPSPEYYVSGHIPETLPNLDNLQCSIQNKEKFRVFTEYTLIKEYLNDPRFEVNENEQNCDILWLTRHFKDFAGLSETSSKMINQFPYEYILTTKDLLALTSRKYLKKSNSDIISPEWFPVTYNLKTEIANFLSYFENLTETNSENYWIIKPFNLARGLDIHITNNVNCIMKLALTGPKIAQRYITNPVLFMRPECAGKVKFDLRYLILLRNVQPLEVAVYKNFFIRFANKPFELRNFDDYEQHFTVMNYNEKAILKHMKCEEFRLKWEEQYPNYDWNGVEDSILKMLKQIVELSVKDAPPCGIAYSPQSRAVYAADLMLEWKNDEIQPKLLEINWTPDCKRACEYYPSFYNDIFKFLFLNQESEQIIQI